MKQLLSFIRKEFKHVFRDKKSLLMLFGMPTVQIILFGFALTNEIKNTKVGIVDYSNDNTTQQLISKINESNYFDVSKYLTSIPDVHAAFKKDEIKVAVNFR